MYLYTLHALFFPDWSHLFQRAQVQSFADANLKRLWFLLMVTWNLNHGKDKDDQRDRELREIMATFYTTRNPKDSPLFQSLLPDLVLIFERKGHIFDDVNNLENEVWDMLRKQEPMRPSGTRMTMCRFQAMIKKPVEKVLEWELDLLERTHLALEMD